MEINKCKVVVTGGGGFIGQNLVKSLLKKGMQVYVIDNFMYGVRDVISKECFLIEGDVRDVNIYKKLPFDIDYIFHFGAPSSIILFNKYPKECIDITIRGFMNILNWALDKRVKKIIYPSSGSVYGLCTPPQSELSTPHPVNIYGKTKMVCESIASVYSKWLKIIGLRIFAGYGPGEEQKKDFASVVTLFLESILQNRQPVIYGDGSQRRDFVYIKDIINAIIKITESDINETIVNVGSGKSYSFNEIIDIINNLLNKDVKPIYIDKPVDYLENTLANIDKFKRITGIEPLTLEEGIREYLVARKIIKSIN